MVKGVQAAKIGKATNAKVKVQSFSGATVGDMKHCVKPHLNQNPTNVIIHLGTNNVKTYEPQEIINEDKEVCEEVKGLSPESNVTLSEIIDREDNHGLQLNIKEVNDDILKYCNENNVCL